MLDSGIEIVQLVPRSLQLVLGLHELAIGHLGSHVLLNLGFLRQHIDLFEATRKLVIPKLFRKCLALGIEQLLQTRFDLMVLVLQILDL